MHGTTPKVMNSDGFVLEKQQRSECSEVRSKVGIKRQLLYVRWRRQAILGEEVSRRDTGRKTKRVNDRTKDLKSLSFSLALKVQSIN